MKKIYKYLNPITGRQVSRQRMWQLQQVALGLCYVCMKPATNGRYCRQHYLKAREAQRRRLRCKSRYLGAKSYRFG